MTHTRLVRFEYFGWGAQFSTAATSTAQCRSEANRMVLARYGAESVLPYVEPGVPFPDYVPMRVWDAGDQQWYGVS